jgi:hypothetical protein
LAAGEEVQLALVASPDVATILTCGRPNPGISIGSPQRVYLQPSFSHYGYWRVVVGP